MRGAAELHKSIGIALRFCDEVGRSGESGVSCVIVDAMERLEGKEKRRLSRDEGKRMSGSSEHGSKIASPDEEDFACSIGHKRRRR